MIVWRDHNRRRWLFEKNTLSADERAPFVCECTSAHCLAPVRLTMRDYESAHTSPTWIAVLPEHVLSEDSAEVIVRHPEYWVVELGGRRSPAPPAAVPAAG